MGGTNVDSMAPDIQVIPANIRDVRKDPAVPLDHRPYLASPDPGQSLRPGDRPD